MVTEPLSELSEFIVKNNRVTAPIISIIASVILIYASLFISSILFFMVPVAVFIVMHYTKMYRIKTRILGSLMIFIIVAILAAAIFSDYGYSHQQPPSSTSSFGTITTYVTPFSGVNRDYNFTMVVNASSPLNIGEFDPTINITNGVTHLVIHQSQINHINKSTRDYVFYYNSDNLSAGIYAYNFSLNSSLYISNVLGPINTYETTYFEDSILGYVISDLIIFELIFLIGVFLARSISNSRRHDPAKNPK
jgi:hypothetical protein